ncbi:hypothetical protein Gohar_013948 [Gossypium harknessii]|uniref:Uncharacterized protein n=1 Tax=Gossypium harknessii TaxID=34285 RepID=A0A7J9H1Q5_9ROSI|nr:hypothetical protein [Gossypium harknessii]
MDNYTGNQDILVPTYTQELVNMTQATQERIQTLKENNKQMMKTISKLGYVIKEELQRLLEEKNKSLSFYEFDLKLPYPTRAAA